MTASQIKQFETWLSDDDSQMALWSGVVTFSDEYYQTLINHAVPLDLRALKSISGSALAMDIYAMLADRLHRINGRPLMSEIGEICVNSSGRSAAAQMPTRISKKRCCQHSSKRLLSTRKPEGKSTSEGAS
ncbi:MAG: replication protein RepA [Candidatus Thiodiazotropha sp. (ex. Lucinoma kazani)]